MSNIIRMMYECTKNPDFHFIKKGNVGLEYVCYLKEGIKLITYYKSSSFYIFHHVHQVMYLDHRKVLYTGGTAIENYYELTDKDGFFNAQILGTVDGFTRADFTRLPQTYEYFIQLARKNYD